MTGVWVGGDRDVCGRGRQGCVVGGDRACVVGGGACVVGVRGNFGALKQPRWCSGVASVDSVSVVVTVPKLKPRGGLFGRRFFLCLLRTV